MFFIRYISKENIESLFCYYLDLFINSDLIITKYFKNSQKLFSEYIQVDYSSRTKLNLYISFYSKIDKLISFSLKNNNKEPGVIRYV